MSLRSIQKYYNNLEYRNNVSLQDQINSIKTQMYSNLKNIKKRLEITICLIEKNKWVFECASGHIDLFTTLVHYLKYIFSEFVNMQKLSTSYFWGFDKEFFKDIWNAIYTLFNMFRNNDIQLFLHAAIIESSDLEKNHDFKKIYKDNYKKLSSCQVIEIIIFEDSDLYAVVNQLKLTGVHLNKIWIQEPVRAKFAWILKKCFQRTFRRLTHVFRTKEELLISNEMHKINIVSIWSEDIIAAKNLAISLNSDIVFINTHMDFFDSTVLLPYTRIFSAPLYETILHEESECEYIIDTNEHNVSEEYYDMYYDGTWQKPIKGKYWMYDECRWANATIEDVHRCIDSAKKGFEIWSAWSVDSRIQTLSKLASILEYKGKSNLSKMILSSIHLPHLEYILSEYSHSGRLDIATFCQPRGVIVLENDNDVTLFKELIQCLVMGNSVIIIHNQFSCTLAPYYDMFSISQIPPGVINVLSCENLHYSSICYSELMPMKHIMSFITRQKKVILPLE